MAADPVHFIEAAYQTEVSTADWLRRLVELLAERVALQFGCRLGAMGFTYQVTEQGRIELLTVDKGLFPDIVGPEVAVPSFSPEYVRQTFVAQACIIASQAGDAQTRRFSREMFRSYYRPHGIEDIFILNGIDPTHLGLFLGVLLPRTIRLPSATRALWSQVAAHLAAGYRVRRTLARLGASRPEDAEAVLTPAGRLEHATAPAAEARGALHHAVRAVERARGRLRQKEPAAAVREWKGLVAARWTLLEHFESDGKRYLLARRNDSTQGGLEALSDRERQAVGLASLGHTNKLIAYEMGISASTVAVLLHRAAGKLEARSRAELVEAFLKHRQPRQD